MRGGVRSKKSGVRNKKGGVRNNTPLSWEKSSMLTLGPQTTLQINGNNVAVALTFDKVLDIAVNSVEFAVESLYDMISNI
jgi:hypothetical protein